MLVMPEMGGWQYVTTENSRGVFTRNWVLKGENGRDWTQMAVLTLVQSGLVPAAQLTGRFTELFRKSCGTLDVLESSESTETDRQAPPGSAANYGTATLLLHCQDSTDPPRPDITLKKHEIVWLKALEGPGVSFLVQRNWHGDAITQDSFLRSDTMKKEWREWFEGVKLETTVPASPRP
ncbi:MAG TPA: hypothetical protein VJ798_12285 [Rhizomicrobium sp.]|nr:hypothetical protein [Rhizomicrobium sp.]